jgi:hypothetical protein
MIRAWTSLQDPDNPLAKVSQSFKEYSQGQGTLAIIVAGVFVLLILGAIFYSLVSARRKSAHWRTFRDFAEASGLTSQETKLLIYVAERVQPENPVALFVKRTVFETAVHDLNIEAARATILRRKVYGP